MEMLDRVSKNPAVILCIVALAMSYGVRQVYADLKERNEVLVTIIREQISESRAVSEAIRSLTSRIESGNLPPKVVD
jgi:hypothetical protein